MSKRYVHPDGDAVLAVMDRPNLTGPDFGHDEEKSNSDTSEEKQLSA